MREREHERQTDEEHNSSETTQTDTSETPGVDRDTLRTPMHRLADESETRENNRNPGSKTLAEGTCPECNGPIIAESTTTETVCNDCGLVIDETMIDYGPEWRAYNAQERSAKSRTGSPLTELQHDKGLSTQIDWKDRDSTGRQLSSEKQRQMRRLRMWDSRSKRDSGDDNIAYANGEIKRMGSALGIPTGIQETAASLYRQAYEQNLIPGRSIEGMSSAAFYIALRVHDEPRPLDEISTIARIDRKSIQRCYQYICRELSIGLEPINPSQYIPRYATELGLPQEFTTTAEQLVNDLNDTHHVSGNDPTVLAASALYASSILHGQLLTQTDVKDVSNVTEVSIRNNYKMFLIHSSLTPFNDDDITDDMTPTDIAKQLHGTAVYIDSPVDENGIHTDDTYEEVSREIISHEEIKELTLSANGNGSKHPSVAPNTYTCPIDLTTYDTRSELLEHLTKQHTVDVFTDDAIEPHTHTDHPIETGCCTGEHDDDCDYDELVAAYNHEEYPNTTHHFSCPVCSVIEETYQALAVHLQLVHDYTGEFPPRETIAVDASEVTPTKQTGKTNTALECQCGTSFASQTAYEMHAYQRATVLNNDAGEGHTPIHPGDEFSLPHVQPVTTLFEPNTRKTETYSNDEYNFLCPECYTVFNSFKGLRIHIGHSHDDHTHWHHAGYAVHAADYPVSK